MNPYTALSDPDHLELFRCRAKVIGFADADTKDLGNLLCGVCALYVGAFSSFHHHHPFNLIILVIG